MHNFLKYLSFLQIVGGIFLIVTSLFTLTNISIVAEESPEIPMIIEVLQGGSPTPEQTQRAAKIMIMQEASLTTLASVAKASERAIEYCGIFLVFSGIVLLIDFLRVRRNNSNRGQTTVSDGK